MNSAFRTFALVLVARAAGALGACGPADTEAPAGDETTPGAEAVPPRSGVVGGPAAPLPTVRVAPDAVVEEDVVYTPRDVEIFQETMSWARREALDTLELGPMIAALGRRFVGATYTPQTLEIPGPERVVVNLREFDCVTYVESMLAMARLLRDDNDSFPAFTEELRRIRYRDGALDGYTSRLHYFSEWIADNEDLGLVRNVTDDLGGIPHDERIDFMSTHADAYPKLRNAPERVEEIREIERRLSAVTRTWIPKARIAGIADGIRDGDIIAATSTVEGLDIAHTGFAIRIDGRLHLMHAPLVGKNVEISELPLADRILRIDGQGGIMVARPL